MEYNEGVSYELSDGSWLKVDVRFDDVDLGARLVEWADGSEVKDPTRLSLVDQYAVLQHLAAEMILRRRIQEYRSRAYRDPSLSQELAELLQRLAEQGSALKERILPLILQSSPE